MPLKLLHMHNCEKVYSGENPVGGFKVRLHSVDEHFASAGNQDLNGF